MGIRVAPFYKKMFKEWAYKFRCLCPSVDCPLLVFFLNWLFFLSNPSVDRTVVTNVLFLLFPHNVITKSEVFQQFITTNFFILMTDILFIEIGQQMLFYDGFKIKLKKISELCVVFLLNWGINVVLT